MMNGLLRNFLKSRLKIARGPRSMVIASFTYQSVLIRWWLVFGNVRRT